MTKPETPDPITSNNGDKNSSTLAYYSDMPPYCGTRTTPPCPSEAFLRTRTSAIRLIVGRSPTREKLMRAATLVDRYLAGSLRDFAALHRGARVLDRGPASRDPARRTKDRGR